MKTPTRTARRTTKTKTPTRTTRRTWLLELAAERTTPIASARDLSVLAALMPNVDADIREGFVDAIAAVIGAVLDTAVLRAGK